MSSRVANRGACQTLLDRETHQPQLVARDGVVRAGRALNAALYGERERRLFRL